MLIMYETEWTGIGYSLIQGSRIKRTAYKPRTEPQMKNL